MSKVTFKPKLICDGCGAECFELPVKTIMTKKHFCSRTCLHVNFFKFPTLQLTHYHELQQAKAQMA